MTHGTWQTTGGGGGGGGGVLAALVAVFAAVALAGVAEGVAQAVASLVVVLVSTGAVVAVMAVAGAAAFLVFRARRSTAGGPPRAAQLPARLIHEIPRAERTRPALEASGSRTLHLHFHGADPEQVAAIIRQQATGEQRQS